jgi:hypothetical protein
MAEVQKDTTGNREDTLRFLDLVGLFGTQGMMALGKLANPATGKSEKNLVAARVFIDMLDMLQRKTQGNLTADETKLLRSTVTDLRLMFIEESKSESKPAAEIEPKTDAEPKK